MARGWIAGLLTGGVVAGLGMGVVSLVMGPVGPSPQRPPVAEAVPEPGMDAPQEAVSTPVPEATPAPEAMTSEPAAQSEMVEEQPVAPEAPVEPAAAEAPEVAPDETSDTPVEEDEIAADETPVAQAPVVEPVSEPQPVAQPEDTTPEQPEAAAPEAVAKEAPAEGFSPETKSPPEIIPEIIVEADPDVAPPEADPAPAPDPEPVPKAEVVVSPEADLPPEVDADPAEVVVTNRLPRIGEAPADTPQAAPEPALSRNALAFAPVGDQPRLAFLLLDTGPEDRAGLGDLGNLPFPVTVAIDASAPDAEAALAFYRDQGAEVILTVPLPEGATATDVDITIEAYKPLLDEAIGVLAEEGLGFQTLGEGAVQLATNLAETGHGLVSYPAGLNTGHKAALKEGVKAGLVFRDLDGAGQAGAVIRRFLDNAAFKARNEDGVIVVARTRPETLQALLEWSLGTRAQSVALAPVSALLAGETGE